MILAVTIEHWPEQSWVWWRCERKLYVQARGDRIATWHPGGESSPRMFRYPFSELKENIHSFSFDNEFSFLDIVMPYWLRNEEVRRIEPHRRTWLPLPLFCFSFMLWILPYLLKMVVFPSWLQQIGHLLYDSYEYQGIELKNTIGINWLLRYDYRIAKAREDPCQRRY